MRTLTLIRHAKSSWKDGSLSDFDRPLNKRGEHNAPMMGRLLKSLGTQFDLMVSSPALRALTTARLIAAELGHPGESLLSDPRIYEAGIEDLLEVVHSLPDDRENVALVGHNPGLTMFCNHLSGENIENLPTCAVAGIAFELDSWEAIDRDSGRLVRYEYPRKYMD
jgi:phosphohistidine phosphatase